MFNHTPANDKSVRLAIIMVVGVAFFDMVAALADKKLRQIAVMLVITGDEGVQSFDAVNQSQLGKEVERAINRGRFGAAPIRVKPVQQIIGFDGPTILDHQFQNMFA